ncbi:alpha-N-acetylglucosaminidase (NAGLU)-like protein [Chitinophaga niastensis]|uniref:Alpha-N-acetylglucosaminidase (NAGLU)-like protein n=1 Tax=Chitinophaga niastensis TaxID=536980 RepID=A0A2P8HVR6_CHINA|nr:alpha-N-acetylglucosaminidase C-terminal domain-containing protein [Chitinophaga niastensis]PSL50275.1 alpha-N-acetylglucosaminidase (NAGLU)-like protein [Chitinophaga niastensis]
MYEEKWISIYTAMLFRHNSPGREDYFLFLGNELNKTGERYIETDAINHRFKRPANEANDFYKQLSRWEYQWCNQQDDFPVVANGDAYMIAKQLYEKWWPVAHSYWSLSR